MSPLALSAKLFILILMMIVFCDGAPLNRTVRLYSVCANSFMKVNATGNVRADNAEDGFDNLTFTSWDFGNMSIYAPLSKRFVCFNAQWKLIGSRIVRPDGRCSFVEVFDEETRFIRIRSLVNERKYIGFTRNGKPIKRAGPRNERSPLKCSEFTKIDRNFNPKKHNEQISGRDSSPNIPIDVIPLIGGNNHDNYNYNNNNNNNNFNNNIKNNNNRNHHHQNHHHHHHLNSNIYNSNSNNKVSRGSAGVAVVKSRRAGKAHRIRHLKKKPRYFANSRLPTLP
ncbi:uncharacterized protein isoform X2 [Rhodnius prolixus]|uniref:uncharacterized protein isoform X2 n=1 Tax=Rhodnius prolixus TaxID=13249 RepID=UPI003D18D3C3